MSSVSADGFILALLAAADIAFLAWLRRRRARRLRVEHMYFLLQLHMRRENGAQRHSIS
jgi:hypothetical protein